MLWLGFVLGFVAAFLFIGWAQYHWNSEAIAVGMIKLNGKIYTIDEVE